MRTRAKAAILALALVAFAEKSARADESVFKTPGLHPDYSVELEPHVFYGFDPPGDAASAGWGPGIRATVEIIDNGFGKTINNTVGLGFGLDWIAFNKDKTAIWVPIVLQWNFWLSRSFSVFAEPGGGIYLGNSSGARPAIFGGGRFHFSETLALTLRVGYPAMSAGLSFAF